MSRLRVHSIAMSLDGYMAGPEQGPDRPLGVDGTLLHEWIFATRIFREMTGQRGGSEGVDDDLVRRGFDGIGATIMGRNMFGPVRESWVDSDWTGWWGAIPPFHHPVFVLTHEPRPSLEMDGGTTFHFVTDDIGSALHRARDAAGDRDVRLEGGAATLQQYLAARLVDEMHVAVVPVILGRGERLFENLGAWPDGYRCDGILPGHAVAHFQLVRQGQ